MKKLLAILVVCLMPICLIAGSVDVNGDGKVNVADIVELLNHLNGKPTKNYNASEADANNDGVVDKNDIKAIADIISSSNLSAVSYDIPIEQLNGWDDGVFFVSENSLENFYLVYKTYQEEDQEAVTICLNSANNEEAKRSVIFNFNKEGTLQDIILSGILFKAFSFTDEMYFVAYNNDGEILGSFSVPCDNIELNTENSLTRASRPRNRSIFRNSNGKISIPKIKEFAKKANPIAKFSIDAAQTVIRLDEGKYGDILLSLVVGGLVGLADWPFFAAIIAEQGVEALLKYIYDLHRKDFLGNAGIEITSIKRTSKTAVTVEGKISNISSIPTTRIEPIESDWGQLVPNVVYWGIAVGKSGQPGLYLNDDCTENMPITSEKFSYTFYLEELPGQILFFRPFLAPDFHFKKSSDIRGTIGKRAVTDIRYGERKEFLDMNVELSNFKQISCNKVNGQYQVQFTIEGKIPGIFDELSSWGFQVLTKSGLVEQCWAKETSDYYPPLEKSFTCKIDINENDIIESSGERIAEISIIPYVSFWNRMPSMQYFESEEYTITLEDKICPDSNHPHWIDLGLPSGTQWRCCNEGASTPEAYGGYYTFGQVASAPTEDQIYELLRNCKYSGTTQNGVKGGKFTGSNGGTIFLPAAGYYCNREELIGVAWELLRVGKGGALWSSSSFRSDDGLDLAYGLDFGSSAGEGTFWYSHYKLSVRPVR